MHTQFSTYSAVRPVLAHKNRVSDPSQFRFPVALENAFDQRGNIVPRTKLVVRKDTDEVLSNVSDRYRLITHEEVMKPVEAFTATIGKGDAEYYVEKNGAKLVATHTYKNVALSLPGHKMHGQSAASVGDTVALRTYSINSYNSTAPFEFQIGALVLRCLNGATAFDSLFSLRYRHIGVNKSNLLEFPDPKVVISAFERQGDQWKTWADLGVNSNQVKTLVEDGRRLQLLSMRSYNENKDYFERADTVWDLYNAFTYVITHSTRTQESGRLTRFDRLNGLFNHTFNSDLVA